MENLKFKQHFATTCRLLTPTNRGFRILEHFLVHFTVLAYETINT